MALPPSFHPLTSFHPLIGEWFAETYGEPTAVQREAWPLIAGGKNVLALAPTGSGKTLAAFLAALSRFIDGTWDPGELSALYVSPLKALNEDIRRNLLLPIEELKRRAAVNTAANAAAGTAAGADAGSVERLFRIRVETRSGDTPQGERRRFLLRPPSILALTPESLAILLLNPRGREVLAKVKYLVVDEIHAVLGTKRGAFLSCQIDRLARLAGNFQRTALSATMNPPELAAEFAGADHIAAPPDKKRISFRVEFPGEADGADTIEAKRRGPRYTALVNRVLAAVRDRRPGSSVLVFTTSRRRAERIAFLLNREAEARGLSAGPELSGKIALCHHGSLSKEVRREVEALLAAGRVPCVAATSSLELGLDIGAVDEVILAGSPASSAQTLQRLGRSGHAVGERCRGTLLPFHRMELLEGAVLAGAVADREIERIRPVKNPLDILAQIALALCVEKPRTPNELFEILRGFYVFRDLDRPAFDRVIAMLTGRYFRRDDAGGDRRENAPDTRPPEDIRLREPRPRLYRDGGLLHAARGVLGLLYSSGGVIPGRGLYSLRLADGVKIGELDEEFVWERRTGDVFDFGARSWIITAIGSEAVTVNPSGEAADFQPFWKADSPFRSAELCRRTLDFFALWNKTGRLPNIPGGETPNGEAAGALDGEASAALEAFLTSQGEALGPLPDHRNIPVEIIDDPALRPGTLELVFHTFRGGALNYPFALALAARVEEAAGLRAETIPDDNAVMLLLPRFAAADPAALVRDCVESLGQPRGTVPAGEALFRRRLESSGVFGAAFREAAERSMILPRGGFGRRLPLWVARRRARALYDKTAGEDFPVTAEAWRTCLADHFDMEAFRGFLADIASGAIAFRYVRNAGPSPFARNLSWRETNSFMYEYDDRKDLLGAAGSAGRGSGPGPAETLADGVIARALADPALRPPVRAETAASFTARLRREIPGYAPEEIPALAQWVRDRIAIPLDQWETLTGALPENSEAARLLAQDPSLGGRIRLVRFSGASRSVVIHADDAGDADKTAETVTGGEFLLARLGEWLRYEGPVRPGEIAAIRGCSPGEAEDALDSLVESGEAIRDLVIEGEGEPAYCDAENADLLFRLARKRARPRIRERPAAFLVPFTALRQGLVAGPGPARPEPRETAEPPVSSLSWYAAPVRLWETEFFPARDPRYRGTTLDGALENGRLLWSGAGRERAAFCDPGEFGLAPPPTALREGTASAAPDSSGLRGELRRALTAFCGEYRSFWEIRDELFRRFRRFSASGGNGAVTAEGLSELVWEAVWDGALSADSWESVRRGIDRGFSGKQSGPAAAAVPGFPVPGYGPPAGAGLPGTGRFPGTGRLPRAARLPRAWRDRWREGTPLPGRWFSLETGDIPGEREEELSALETEELNLGRVRLLLRRWGVLCRPLVETESFFSWGALLPAMRRMELAGELVTGRFFDGIPSLQFAPPSIAEDLEAAEALCRPASGTPPVYWMNAADPSSPSGWNIEGLDRRLPARTGRSRLCFRGGELAAVSGRGEKELSVFPPPEDPALPELLSFMTLSRRRDCHRAGKVVVERINGRPAGESPYGAALKALGFSADRDKLVLW